VASALAVRVTPGARTNAWAGRLPDGRWKLKIAAPPIDGRANEALERFVAESLGLAPRAVRVAKGASGRDKVLWIELDAALLEARLRAIGDGKAS
jgi:uncharacterized protein YggU (UPF0235/DUF167 family)